ncbi:hypothetical protein [Streptomyces sp. NPDC016845]|uniref:hypothetical protein n=1 Tax=Streptomyces sp. NPDC016845 TaxID=3364972 RepID=UPI00379DB72D
MAVSRKRSVISTLVLLAALAGCTSDKSDTPDENDRPDSLTRSADPSEGRRDNDDRDGNGDEDEDESQGQGQTSAGTGQGDVDVLLADQITLFGAGNGTATDCSVDRPAQSPAVWMVSTSELQLVAHVSLCLAGFGTDQEIDVTVTAGSRSYSVTAMPGPGPVDFLLDQPPETLFDQDKLPMYDIGDGTLQSGMWTFVPPDSARAQIAAAGGVRFSATQGDTRATGDQPIALPEEPDRIWLDAEASILPDPGFSHRLVVFGYEPGRRIPVGLYRVEEPGSSEGGAVLERQLGIITMHSSRVTVYQVPADALQFSTGGRGCITVPIAKQYNCPSVA